MIFAFVVISLSKKQGAIRSSLMLISILAVVFEFSIITCSAEPLGSLLHFVCGRKYGKDTQTDTLAVHVDKEPS